MVSQVVANVRAPWTMECCERSNQLQLARLMIKVSHWFWEEHII